MKSVSCDGLSPKSQPLWWKMRAISSRISRGSFSLKSVVPAIAPEMTYDSLAIQEGNQASFEYLRMLDPTIPRAERDKIKEDLLQYCAQDTLAMVRIREELIKRC